jgi:hypothetical protein
MYKLKNWVNGDNDNCINGFFIFYQICGVIQDHPQESLTTLF